MECLWRLFRYRQPHGHSPKPYPAVLYLHFIANNGFSDHYLYGIGLLEKYEELRKGGAEKSVVLFVRNPETPSRPSPEEEGVNTQPLLFEEFYVFRIFLIIISFLIF